MNNKLILRTENSPYGDITKGSVLSQSDLDNNQIFLKGEIIYTATSENGIVTLNKYNGQNIEIGVITCDTLSACTVISNLQTIVYQQNQLVTGSVTYLSGLTFDITPLVYIIDGTFYTIPNATQVTLASGDSVYDRIDVIYADISGNTGVIQGTPSDNPVKPGLGPDSQVEVSFVSIPAGATAPAITSTLVYDEMAGPPTEWTTNNYSASFVIPNSTTQAYSGTKSVRFSGCTLGKIVEFSSSTIFNTTNQNVIQFAIKNPIAWPSTAKLQISLLSSSNIQIGNVVQIYNGIYGFSASNIATWQVISVPTSAFALTTPFISKLRFTTNVTGTQKFNAYIDQVKFIAGIPTLATNPNWRYMRVDSGASIGATTPNDTLILSGGTNIGTRISGTNAIIFDLDNNIRVSGLTATTISATTYLNLPISGGAGFTGWTGSSGTLSIKANNNSGNYAGNYAIAEGYSTSALSLASHSEGYFTTATGSSISVTVPATIISGVTISNSDPTYSGTSGKSIVLNNDVSTDWSNYLFGSCPTFTLYGGTGSTSLIDCNTLIDVYYDAGTNKTYIVDSSIINTSYTQFSGITNISNSLASSPSHAEGILTIASGITSHAEGFQTLAGGNYSHAEGRETIASGDYSHVGGYQSFATGLYSFSHGYGATAIGDASHAESSAIAQGHQSHAEGAGSQATGLASHAEGIYTIAYGDYSHAEGRQTTVSGSSSHVEGYFSIASGNTSHAEGYFSVAGGAYSHAEGVSSYALGIIAHAEGNGTRAEGDSSHAEGYQTTASGEGSHSEGYQTIASNYQSHAEGDRTTSSGNRSHAEGGFTVSSGDASHAEGNGSTASGTAAHTEGSGTLASGNYSHSEGQGSTASAESSHAEGKQSYATGLYSHAEGYLTTASGIGSHASGSGTTAFGQYSHAEGNSTTVFGNYSHGEGNGTVVIGNGSHGEGSSTTVLSDGSHAEGYLTTASGGLGSHAEGAFSSSSNIGAHAEGVNTTASGYASHAGGQNTTASGSHSLAHGSGSTASGDGTVVFGYNITGTSDNTVYVNKLNIKLIGNGTPILNLGVDTNGFVVTGTTSIGGSFSQVGAVTTTFTVTGLTQTNNTYKVCVTPTNVLSAAAFYVNNKTTTTFDVVYLAGLTGTVTFDWILTQ